MSLIQNAAACTKRNLVTPVTSEHFRFACRDRLNREIGCIADRFMVEFVPTEESYGYRVEPGMFFATKVQASRNGVSYGASQRTEYFGTEAEREAYIAKRVAASHKAALKKEA